MPLSSVLGSWNALPKSDLSDPTEPIILNMAQKFQVRDVVRMAVERAKIQTSYSKSVHWRPSEIAQGDAGLALLFTYLDLCYPGEGYRQAAHDRLKLAAAYAEREAAQENGLWAGLAGLAFSVWYASQGTPIYQCLLKSIERILLPSAVSLSNE